MTTSVTPTHALIVQRFLTTACVATPACPWHNRQHMKKPRKRRFTMIRDFQVADFLTLGNGFAGMGSVLASMKYVATTDITFTCPGAELERARHVLMDARDAIGFKAIETASDVVKVSCIGRGMRSHARR